MLIRRETLQAVKPATTTDDTRYALNMIRIEPDGSCVATNGHILIKATETAPMPAEDYPLVPGLPEHLHAPTDPILLDAEIAERLCKATPKQKSQLDILKTISISSNGDGSSYAAVTDLNVPVVVKLSPNDMDRHFPDYARVVPKAGRKTVAIGLGVAVLEALIKSAKAVGAEGIRVEVPISKPEVIEAITATYKSKSGDVDVYAVAMPMRL